MTLTLQNHSPADPRGDCREGSEFADPDLRPRTLASLPEAQKTRANIWPTFAEKVQNPGNLDVFSLQKSLAS